jgi:hypothetical protein
LDTKMMARGGRSVGMRMTPRRMSCCTRLLTMGCQKWRRGRRFKLEVVDVDDTTPLLRKAVPLDRVLNPRVPKGVENGVEETSERQLWARAAVG